MTDRDKEIIRLYVEEKKSMGEIGKQFQVITQSIHGILKKHNIPRRPLNESHTKISRNKDYFKVIDTQEKAYILGLLYADGNNYAKTARVSISLQENDKEILQTIKDHIEYKGNLRYVVKPPPQQNQWSLSITSQHMSKDLEKLGCVPKKSLILKFPTEEQVPKELLRHFIRGYFDGDGCLTTNKNTGGYSLNFTGTSEFLTGVLSVFNKEVGTNFQKLYRAPHRKDKNNFAFTFGGRPQIKNLLDWLYKDSTIHLARKYNKYQEFNSYYLEFFLEQLKRKDFSKNKMCVTPDCYNVTYSNKEICKSCFYNRKPTTCSYVT